MRGLTMLSLAFLLPAIAGCTPTPAEQARIDQRQATERADLDSAPPFWSWGRIYVLVLTSQAIVISLLALLSAVAQ